jgi:hypothetical protein
MVKSNLQIEKRRLRAAFARGVCAWRLRAATAIRQNSSAGKKRLV